MIIYSRTKIATDEEGNLTDLKTLTPNNQVKVNDEEVLSIQKDILKQLKIMNIHLAITTDTVINDYDVL